MDEAISNAMRRRHEIAAELEEIDVFLRLHAKYSGSQNITMRARISTAVESVANDSATIGGQRRLGPPELADLCARLIRDENRPLSRTELVELLHSRGIFLPTQDKSRYIGTILWRNRERFVNLAGRGYVLAESLTPAELESARRQERSDADDEGDQEASGGGRISASFVLEFIKDLSVDDHRRAHRDASVSHDVHPEILNKLFLAGRREKGAELSDPEKGFIRSKFIETVRRQPLSERIRP